MHTPQLVLLSRKERLEGFDNFKLNLPGQELCTIVFATGASSAKLAAVNTLLVELAMSFS